MTRATLYRKSFSFTPTDWIALKQVAIEKGYPNRNRFITTTLKGIIADHQAKSQDVA